MSEFPVIRVYHGTIKRSGRAGVYVEYDPAITVAGPVVAHISPVAFDSAGMPTRYRATVTPQS